MLIYAKSSSRLLTWTWPPNGSKSKWTYSNTRTNGEVQIPLNCTIFGLFNECSRQASFTKPFCSSLSWPSSFFITSVCELRSLAVKTTPKDPPPTSSLMQNCENASTGNPVQSTSFCFEGEIVGTRNAIPKKLRHSASET